ncbi:MAG TPA: DUF2512 family protein [Bacillota bacterium]|jgi:hypothetical protein
MRHVTALIIKFLMLGLVALIALPLLAKVTAMQAIGLAVALTVIAYILDDLLILPAFGNGVATVADVVLAFLTLWAANFVVRTLAIGFWAAAITAVIIGVGEYFFHTWLQRANVVRTKQP